MTNTSPVLDPWRKHVCSLSAVAEDTSREVGWIFVHSKTSTGRESTTNFLHPLPYLFRKPLSPRRLTAYPRGFQPWLKLSSLHLRLCTGLATRVYVQRMLCTDSRIGRRRKNDVAVSLLNQSIKTEENHSLHSIVPMAFRLSLPIALP